MWSSEEYLRRESPRMSKYDVSGIQTLTGCARICLETGTLCRKSGVISSGEYARRSPPNDMYCMLNLLLLWVMLLVSFKVAFSSFIIVCCVALP